MAPFAGRRTASGERYDPRKLTAAHKSLPLGTLIRVKDSVSLEDATRELQQQVQQSFGWPGGALEITPLERQARQSLLIYAIVIIVALPAVLLIGFPRSHG